MAGSYRYDWDWRPHYRPGPRWGGGYESEFHHGPAYGRGVRHRGLGPRRPFHAAAPLEYDVDYHIHRQRPTRRRHYDTRFAAPSHRRAREPHRPWTGDWRPDAWWHAIGPEPRADYDWAYAARRPERYGWTGETGRG